MAQPSIVSYFNTKKRAANDEVIDGRAKKVIIVDKDVNISSKTQDEINSTRCELDLNGIKDKSMFLSETEKLTPNKIFSTNQAGMANKVRKSRTSNKKLTRTSKGQTSLQMFITKSVEDSEEKLSKPVTEQGDVNEKDLNKNTKCHKPIDEVSVKKDISLSTLKQKLKSNSRIEQMKASISRFNEYQNRLKQIEKVTSNIASPTKSPKLNSFRSVELEVDLSPQKPHTPEKSYLSPKKDNSVKKNLLNLFSPTKTTIPVPEDTSKRIYELTSKPALTLPFKYRCIAEIFRSVDTICQIIFNRKEKITFTKLKPAVENMTKRNMTTHILAQIKSIYPDAFRFHQEKLWNVGNGRREEKWDLVITPIIDGSGTMTSEILLTRRRILFEILLDKVKTYHQEFLINLEPPMCIPKEKITRWHPEFDIEKVPDIEEEELPKPPEEMKCLSGQDVLNKACQIFKYNNRMEQVLERMKEETKAPALVETYENNSILKGIPKALLEKVRQKQAAKALLQMTRSANQEQELKMYSRLPELSRLLKNLFISEKKSVLRLDAIVEKLENYYKISMTKVDIEEHIKIIVKELPEWLILYKSLNKVWFLKVLKKDGDLSFIRTKLEKLIKDKNDQLN